MRAAGAAALALLLAGSLRGAEPARLLDGFESLEGWKAVASDGVSARVTAGEGCRGKALRLDYDFAGGSGYAVARRALRLSLPANWALSFCLRAEGAPNDLELKLVDPSGENVWWWRRKGLAASPEFERVVVKKRHVSFAWGPAGGGEPSEIAALELAVVAGSGGKGALFLDELSLDALPEPAPPKPPVASAMTGAYLLDLGAERALGGAVVTWEKGRAARDFALETFDGGAWRTLREVRGNGREASLLSFPEVEATKLRVVAKGGGPFGVAAVELEPPSFSESRDPLVLEAARRAPRGHYPRGYSGEQVYWTVAGVDGDPEEVLVSEDGALEPGKGSFSLEPFLLVEGRLLTWSDVRIAQELAEGFVPVPTVTWNAGPIELSVTALVDGPPGASTLRARYRTSNKGAAAADVRLFVAIRPLLVNPPAQFLNAPHGVSPITALAWDGRAVLVNGGREVVPLDRSSGWGALASDTGELVDGLARVLPPAVRLNDPTGLASGALSWNLRVPPGGRRDVVVAVPLGPGRALVAADFDARLAAAVREWREKLTRVGFRVPPEAEPLVATLRSNLGYVLVNRDGPRIQPGSRAYERSWIRDGSLTSSALLRLGHADVVKEFLVWFAGYQFASGKVPCCVDARGADPVPENDSHGEFLFLAAEYFRFTKDRGTLEALWPRIERAVATIDLLRKQDPAGILPKSISHEGYSDKPVHSYWDDFFALKGLKDAVWLAGALGRDAEAASWSAIRDAFRKDLYVSLRRTIAENGIDFLPGSVERHDFDPTSTTTMLSPGGEGANLPQPELRRTFERYVTESRARRDGTRKSDAYTPYELRTVGALVRLGMKSEALEMLDFFLKDRRPAAWNQWAEVVAADPRAPRFLGDMPHTWVGTDFIRSFLDLFAYEREADGALVLGAGLPESWLRTPGGVAVTGLRTPYGPLDLSLSASGERVRARIGGVSLPPGGFALSWPLPGSPRRALVNGSPAEIRGGEIVVREVPAEVVADR